jgi:hypothetical protein
VSSLDLAPVEFQELVINKEQTIFFSVCIPAHAFSSFLLYRTSVQPICWGFTALALFLVSSRAVSQFVCLPLNGFL